MHLTERQRELLRWLDDEAFRTPMDLGGTNGSHHSATLAQLARKGLAERKKLHAIYCPNGSTQRKKLVDGYRWEYTEGHPPYEGCRCKGSCRYRRTPAGTKVVIDGAKTKTPTSVEDAGVAPT